MARISELPELTALDGADEIVVTDSSTSDLTTRSSVDTLVTYLEANLDLGTTIDGINDVPGLQTALTALEDGKANVDHTHIISQVLGLRDELDTKYDSSTAGILGNTVIIGSNSININDVVNEAVADITGVSPTDSRIPGNVTIGNRLVFTSTNGQIGEETPQQFKADLLLNNVDNTADVDKPISSATQSALDLKVGIDAFTEGQAAQDALIAVNTAKNGITDAQAAAIVANTAKITYPSSDSTKLAGIEAGADVTDTANVWTSLGISTTGSTGSILTERGVFVNASEIPTNITKASVDGALTGLGANVVLKMNADNNEVEASSIVDEGSGVVKIADISPRTPKSDGYVVVTADGTLGTASGANPATTLPPNVVTTDTSQTITGAKTISGDLTTDYNYGTRNRLNWILPTTLSIPVNGASSFQIGLGNFAADNISNIIGFVFPSGFISLDGEGNSEAGTVDSPVIVGDVIPVPGTTGITFTSYDVNSNTLTLDSVDGGSITGVNAVNFVQFIVNQETGVIPSSRLDLGSIQQANISDDSYLGVDADGSLIRSVVSQKGVSSTTITISDDRGEAFTFGNTPSLYTGIGAGLSPNTTNDGILSFSWSIDSADKPPFVNFYTDNVTEYVFRSFPNNDTSEVDLVDIARDFNVWMEDTSITRTIFIDFRTATNQVGATNPSIMTTTLNTWFNRCTAEVRVPVFNNESIFNGTATFNGLIQSNSGIRFDVAGDIHPTTPLAANTLDDYEEGTWTPVYSYFSFTTFQQEELVFDSVEATYSKVGNTVHLWCELGFPSTSPDGASAITGLPFTPSVDSFGSGGLKGSHPPSGNYGVVGLRDSGFWLHSTNGGELNASSVAGNTYVVQLTYQTN